MLVTTSLKIVTLQFDTRATILKLTFNLPQDG